MPERLAPLVLLRIISGGGGLVASRRSGLAGHLLWLDRGIGVWTIVWEKLAARVAPTQL